jgi:hypothetical protein
MLLEAVAVQNATQATTMREWSAVAQSSLLLHLASMYSQDAVNRSEELWRVRKGDRELICMAKYVASGIDLRLIEGVDCRRTQLCRDGPTIEALAEKWRTALLDVGWVG